MSTHPVIATPTNVTITVEQPDETTPSMCRQTAYCWAPLACCMLSTLASGIALWTQADRCKSCGPAGEVLTIVPIAIAGFACVCMGGQALLNGPSAR